MKIILTGSTGNLGSQIVQIKNIQFFPIDREGWSQLNTLNDSEYHAVIHCAYDLKKNINDVPDEVLDSNIISTARLLRLCKEKKISTFVFISSCAVYGDSSNSSEDKICQPVSINGHTKLFNEELVKNFCLANKINYLILRVFNTYGGNDHFSVVQKIISSAKLKKKFNLVNEGVSERDFIHVGDVAQIIGKLLDLKLKNEIINVGSGDSVRIIDILKAVENKFGKIEIESKSNPKEAVFSRANILKLKSLIDYKPVGIIDYLNNL
jgi:nucleoside-diphosphate-sugar epimerase